MTTDDRQLLQAVLRSSAPLLDVRAPEEFAGGAFPQSINLPLLTDSERHRVGLTYRHSGQDAAVALGHKIVSGSTRDERVERWGAFVDAHPGARVCCWRGGMRSRLVAGWIRDSGRACEVVPGGFKALRGFGMDVVSRAVTDKGWLVLGGKTGSGKTELLAHAAGSVDIEGAAHHRGSAFGGRTEPQPSQVSFEARLAVALCRHDLPRVIAEDESRNLGTLAIPEEIVQRMRRSPVVVVDVDFDQRMVNILRDYVTEPLAGGDQPSELCTRYRAALQKLRKRLGDQRWRRIDAAIEQGFSNDDHEPWIAGVLSAYYDPMYEYQLERKRDRVVFEGSPAEVLGYLAAAPAAACDRPLGS